MKFYVLDKVKPENSQYCVIKEKINGRKTPEVFYHPQFYYDDTKFLNHPNVVMWAPVPEHVTKNKEGWKSEYWGDPLPQKNCECLVCIECKSTVQYSYFISDKQKFRGNEDIIAFMVI